ncbi:MAG TPA: lipoate--protein ligase family protein [Bacteroidota bacterium]|nr:lipoate--protein ligase family protein [Bacteroidota bacterium]
MNTGHRSGITNMNLDIRLANQVSEGALPVLRLYGWNPHAISIGMHQRFEDFDPAALSNAGLDIVRRPTGGMAILHANELTYSVAMPLGSLSLREAYRFINEALLQGLRMLGIPAELSASSEDFREAYRNAASIPCFSTSAKCEIQAQGKKLLGSAQRRYGNVVLQHGSLLLGPEHREITEYLSHSLQQSKSLMVQQLGARATDAESILGTSVPFEDAAAAVRRGFEAAHGIEFSPTDVSYYAADTLPDTILPCL